MTAARPLAVVVLAAGEGTRMRSATPKVLHELAGRTLLGHVVLTARALQPDHLVVVVGHARDRVVAALAGIDPLSVAVVQAEQRGTGHAVRTALSEVPELATLGAPDGPEGTVLVLPGDAPLLSVASLRALLAEHAQSAAATTMLTAHLGDPAGYGRVLRDGLGGVSGVVEHRDATADQRAISEVATSVYAFSATDLRQALARLGTDNAQGEEYLTDVVALHRDAGKPVAAHVATDPQETLGINDRAQLAETARLLRDRIVRAHLLAGVAVLDPQTTWIDIDAQIAADATICANTQVRGSSVIGADAVLGPDTTVVRTEVGERARVLRSDCTDAVIGADATVGPFSYLRPGTVLGAGAKVGAFVEVKASVVGPGSKVPHLSYVGDATIGERSNIGAGTIVVNYDGQAKHRTTIGDDVRVGSNNSLIAPVTVADGAYTAAGSAITAAVPAGALAVARAKQRNIEGWVARRRRPADKTDGVE